MIWFFERHQDRLHYEIRHQTDGPDFELVITHPDGRQDIERYSDHAALGDRASRLQLTLTEAGWISPEPRPRPKPGLRSA